MGLLDLSHGGFRFIDYIEISRNRALKTANLCYANAVVFLDYDSSGIAWVRE